jgi:hypothetical protein
MLRIEQIFGGREVFSFGPEGIGGQGLLFLRERLSHTEPNE